MTSWKNRPIGSFPPRMRTLVLGASLAWGVILVVAAAVIAAALVQHVPPDWRIPAWLVVYPVVAVKVL